MTKAATAHEAGSPVAVHSLDHYAMSVPDLDIAERFYKCAGLDVNRGENRIELRTFGSTHAWAEIFKADRKRLMSLTFGIYERDLPSFAAVLEDIRIEGPTPNIWCRSPDGLDIEVAVAAKSSPDCKASVALPHRYTASRGSGPRRSRELVQPRRLAHIAIFTNDVLASVSFYEKRFGLRLSDQSGSNVAFMHAPHGSDHHMIAIGLSTGPGFHHCSWDVESIEDVGRGAAQMRASGYAHGWGLGRHVLGSNYFHYVKDPWGSYCEYSADMDYIAAGQAWVPGDHPDEDSSHQWGPPIPEDFARNHEID